MLTKFYIEWAINMKIWKKKNSFERMYFKSKFMTCSLVANLGHYPQYILKYFICKKKQEYLLENFWMSLSSKSLSLQRQIPVALREWLPKPGFPTISHRILSICSILHWPRGVFSKRHCFFRSWILSGYHNLYYPYWFFGTVWDFSDLVLSSIDYGILGE